MNNNTSPKKVNNIERKKLKLKIHRQKPPLLKQEFQHILIINLRQLGDILLTTPLISTLQLNYPNAKIDLLLYHGTEVMLAGNPAVNQLFVIYKGTKQKGLIQQYLNEIILWKNLHAQPYDLLINLCDQWRTAFYSILLPTKLSLAFQYPKRRNPLWKLCFSSLMNTTNYDKQHTVLNNLSIIESLSLNQLITKVTPPYDRSAEKIVHQLIKYHHLKEYIMIQPTARWNFKTWSATGFSQVINYLISCGKTVILTGSNSIEDQTIIHAIIANCNKSKNFINLAGQLTIPQLATLIGQAKLFIGVDSMPMHLAAALNTPSVILFGPTNITQWHPWEAPHKLLWAGDYRNLPLPEEVNTQTKERYLEAIPVSDVITNINTYLTS